MGWKKGFRVDILKKSGQLGQRNFPKVGDFNSIQNSLFSTQHIVHTTMFFFAYDMDSAYVGSFPNIII